MLRILLIVTNGKNNTDQNAFVIISEQHPQQVLKANRFYQDFSFGRSGIMKRSARRSGTCVKALKTKRCARVRVL